MSLENKKSCSFKIRISQTTIVQPGYCHSKSEVAALNWCWCCHVVFWSDAPPLTHLPITESVLQDPGCQLCSSYYSCRYKVLDKYLATSSQGRGGGDTPLYSNLKVIAVPVLATILHTAPLRSKHQMQLEDA